MLLLLCALPQSDLAQPEPQQIRQGVEMNERRFRDIFAEIVTRECSGTAAERRAAAAQLVKIRKGDAGAALKPAYPGTVWRSSDQWDETMIWGRVDKRAGAIFMIRYVEVDGREFTSIDLDSQHVWITGIDLTGRKHKDPVKFAGHFAPRPRITIDGHSLPQLQRMNTAPYDTAWQQHLHKQIIPNMQQIEAGVRHRVAQQKPAGGEQ